MRRTRALEWIEDGADRDENCVFERYNIPHSPEFSGSYHDKVSLRATMTVEMDDDGNLIFTAPCGQTLLSSITYGQCQHPSPPTVQQ